MSAGKVVLGTVAGIAIGAIAGILFAPAKGSETRKQIVDEGDYYVDELKSKVNEFRNSASEKIKNVKKDAEGIVDKGKEKFGDAKNDLKNAAANYNHDGGTRY